MLLHIRPRLFCPYTRDVKLVDIALDPPGLQLRGGSDLITRRPYVNKHYAVGCPRYGRNKAFDGILVEMDRPPASEMVYTARWAFDAERMVTHQVTYQLLDDDF